MRAHRPSQTALQVADYLEADLAPACTAICQHLQRDDAAAPAVWQRLKQEHAGLRAAIIARHPRIADPFTTVEQLLAALPSCIALHAVRNRLVGTVPAESSDVTTTAPALELDPVVQLDSKPAAKCLLALLPALTEVRSLRLRSRALLPPQADAAGPETFCAKLLQGLPQLSALKLDCTYDVARVLPAAARLTGLASLFLCCAHMPVSSVNAWLRPCLEQLTQLRRLAIAPVAPDFSHWLSMDEDAAGRAANMARPSIWGLQIAEGLRGLRALTHLKIQQYYMRTDEARAFGRALRGMTQLRALKLRNMNVDDAEDEIDWMIACEHMLKAIDSLQLRALNVKKWEIEMPFQQFVCMLACMPAHTLQRLGISRRGDHAHDQRRPLMQQLARFSSLEVLDVTYFMTYLFKSSQEAADEAQALQSLAGMRALIMRNNAKHFIGRGAAAAMATQHATWHAEAVATFVAAAAQHWPALQHIALVNCWFTDGAMRPFTVALRNCVELRVLTLHGVCISSAGEQALAAALPALTQLRAFTLSGDFTEFGGLPSSDAALLVPGLAQLRCLRLLSINGTTMSAATAAALLRVCPGLAELRELSLACNSVLAHSLSGLAVPEVASSLRACTGLLCVDFTTRSAPAPEACEQNDELADEQFGRLLTFLGEEGLPFAQHGPAAGKLVRRAPGVLHTLARLRSSLYVEDMW